MTDERDITAIMPWFPEPCASTDPSHAYDHEAIKKADEEIGRLRDEVSDLRFLIGMALDRHGHSAWRGHLLRVSPHVLRRLREAAQNGSYGDAE